MKFNVDLASLYGGGIYVIRNNVNDKVYIGRTKSFQNRAIEHCNSMYSGKCNYKFKELIGLYPNIEFSFEVLERCLDIVKREEYYINKFKAVENGLNILHNDEEFRKIYRRSAKPKKREEKAISVAEKPKSSPKVRKGSRYWHPADLKWIRQSRAYKVINGKKHDFLGNEL